jgi:hypothetical protein
MLSLTDKQNIVVDCFINAIPSIKSRIPKRHYRLYAWRPGSDDVKIIAALDDESAARIAVQARIDHNEMTEQEALEYVTTRDLLAEIDLTSVFFQGEAPLWNGLQNVGDSVDKA